MQQDGEECTALCLYSVTHVNMQAGWRKDSHFLNTRAQASYASAPLMMANSTRESTRFNLLNLVGKLEEETNRQVRHYTEAAGC